MVGSPVRTRDSTVISDLFNVPVTANVNIYSRDLTPDHSPIAYWIIYCAFQATGTLTVQRTQTSSGVTVQEILNSNNPLTANTAYVFVIPVSATETINLQYSAPTSASKLTILEVMESR